VGPLGRSVEDLGLLLSAMAGADPEHAESVAAPSGWTARVGTAPADAGPLRVGMLSNLDEIELHADVRRALDQAAETFRRLGARVERIDLPGYEPSRARRAGLLVIEAEAWVAHEAALAATPEAFSPELRRMLEYGRDAQAGRLIKAERLIQAAGFALRRALREVDVVLAPTAAAPAFPFDEPAPAHLADPTALANFAGCPAVSVPCGLSADGLPIGLQLIAGPFQEARLLQIARVLEAAAPPPPPPEPRPRR
jgi:aspartyl-tRNA(Asn)/glutamyl-tRNA(Gln) amidotransferase subunit A